MGQGKPWEDYQETPAQGGPWEDYQAPQQPSLGQAPAPQGLGDASGFDLGQSARSTGRMIYDNYIKQQLIPTAASALATRLPALTVGGPMGLIAAPVVEGLYQGVAGYLSEKANQATGITPPDDDAATLQGTIAGGIAALGKGISMGKEFVGRKGAVNANKIAETEARQLVTSKTPTVQSVNLFHEADAEGARVPMGQTEAYVNSIVSNLMRNDSGVTARNLRAKLGEHYGEAGKTVFNLYREFQHGPEMTSTKWQFYHSRLGAKLGAMGDKSTSTVGKGEADQLYARMLDDLERQAENEVRPQNTGIVSGGVEVLPSQGGPDIKTYKRPQIEGQNTFGPNGEIYQGGPQGIEPYRAPQGGTPATVPPTPEAPPAPAAQAPTTQGLGATKLLTALRGYRDEKSIERIQKALENATKINKGQGGDTQFNAQEVIRALKKDRFYPKAFGGEQEGAATRKEIEDLLLHLNTAPNLPAPGSINAGSKRIMERLTAAGALGAAGGASLGPEAAAVGVAGGLASKDVAEFAHNLAFAMGTKTGRALVKELSKTKTGFFTPRNLAVLSSYATALQHDPEARANTE